MNKTTDRPPILRFMAMFMGLLILATGLAALSSAGELPSDTAFTARDDLASDHARGAAGPQQTASP